jgi:tRNA nucleotidyltransferase (CCA-adding enzyme)
MKDLKVFMVGGAVRDLIMGLEPKDRDYVVVGATPNDMLSRGFTQVGADFPVFLHPVTNEEFALARTERKSGPGYHGFDVDFSSDITLEEDLARRDLTINSMAMEVLKHGALGDIVDPFGGRRDINEMVLRHTSGAFRDDPVRALRLARFTARFPKFGLDNKTGDLIYEMIQAGELDNLTAERIWAEFEKGLMEKNPARMIFTLHHLGILGKIPGFSIDTTRLNALDEAARNDEHLFIRYSMIKIDANVELDKRIPYQAKELAEVVTKHSMSFRMYGGMAPPERVDFLSGIDAFRKTERFSNFCIASKYLMQAGGHGLQAGTIENEIKSDLHKISLINQQAIAVSCINKNEIWREIRNARITAIWR